MLSWDKLLRWSSLRCGRTGQYQEAQRSMWLKLWCSLYFHMVVRPRPSRQDKNHSNAFNMWCWCRILIVAWIGKTNTSIIKELYIEKCLFSHISERIFQVSGKFYGAIVRTSRSSSNKAKLRTEDSKERQQTDD